MPGEKAELKEGKDQTVRVAREMTPVVCPCCGEFIPIELILNAGDVNEYMEFVGINQCGYTQKDSEKPWPVLALEIKMNEKKLMDDRVRSLLKHYEESKSINNPNL